MTDIDSDGQNKYTILKNNMTVNTLFEVYQSI